MKLIIDTLVLGGGYSGLVANYMLLKKGVSSFVVERGYRHGRADKDYVIFTKEQYDFSMDSMDINIKKESSGSRNFEDEYVDKLYNMEYDGIKIFYEKTSDVGFPISTNYLLTNTNVYGNIVVNKIDHNKKIVYGEILHKRSKVEIEYKKLINTLPLHIFERLLGSSFYKDLGLFISYTQIGIKRLTSITNSDSMNIEYISDPNIPFYRKQHYKNTIYYEYCINKPMSEKFDHIITPGKFIKPKDNILDNLYSYMEEKDIYLLGRNAVWDPDFLIEDIITKRDIDNRFIKHIERMNNAHTTT